MIHTVNIELRKLNKNNIRNTDKTWQFKQRQKNKCSKCPLGLLTLAHSIGIKNKNIL